MKNIPNPEKELNIIFKKRPLLFGGGAMEYYGIRKRGKDVGFIVSKQDLEMLMKKFPSMKKEFEGDHGVMVGDFEFWGSFCLLDYNYLIKDSRKEDNFLVISPEKLLLLKSVGVLLFSKKSTKKVVDKYTRDVKLLLNKIKVLD